MDLAPTAAWLLEVDPPAGLAGRILEEALVEGSPAEALVVSPPAVGVTP